MASVVRAVRTGRAARPFQCDPDHARAASFIAPRIALLGRAGEVGHDAAVGEEQDAVGGRGGARVVRDHDGRLAVLVDRGAQQVEHAGAGGGVEVAGRLVGEQHGRACRSARGRRRRAAAGRRRAAPACGRGARRGPSAPAARRRRAARACGRRSPAAAAMFSSAESVGSRLKDWKTKPMCLRRRRVRSRSDMRVMSSPAMWTAPASGVSSPASRCISVDLPEPDGPITAVNWPCGHLDRDAAQRVHGASRPRRRCGSGRWRRRRRGRSRGGRRGVGESGHVA